jgi:hypothetical protein
MFNHKFLLVFSVVGIFSFVSIGSAMVATGQSSSKVSSPAVGLDVQKKTVVVKKIESNTIYTFNDQKIDLYHVKVSNFTSHNINTTSKKTITAELLYVDGVLKEAVIREQ